MVYEKGLIRVDRGQLIDKGNYAFDPAHPDFAGGADPDGLKDASMAFVDCDTEAFQRGASVRPSIGVYRIARNITLKSGWDLPEGVVIRPDSGVTVTFDGRVRGMGDRDAQLDTSAGGSFTTNGPEWFYGDQGFLGTIIDRGGAQHDARAYGAVLDGTTDDRTALADAITAAQASGVKVVIVAGGTALVGSNLTVPEGVTLRVLEGAKLKPANGVTLTINGTFDAGLYSVFDPSEGGSVVLGTGAVASVLPHWWGAVGDGVADDRAALSAADAAAAGREILLPAGTYSVPSALTITSALRVEPGAVLKPGVGVTLTLEGALAAGLYRIFDLSAGGTVAIADGAVEYVVPHWWGAVGDGVADDRAALSAADATGRAVMLPAGTYRVGSSLTLASAWQVRSGGLFRPANGVTVTINGTFEAGLYQVFEEADPDDGRGFVFGPGAVERVFMSWFGDDERALQKALDAAPDGATVVVPDHAKISITKGLTVSGKSIKLRLGNARLSQAADVEMLRWTGSWGTINSVVSYSTQIDPFSDPIQQRRYTRLTLSDNAVDLAPGDLVKVFSEDYIRQGYFATRKRGEFARVVNVSGNIVDLAAVLYDEYTTNIRVARMDPLSIEIEGGVFDVDTSVAGYETWRSYSVRIIAALRPVVTGMRFEGSSSNALIFQSCYQYRVHDFSAENLPDDPSNERYGYGITDAQSEGGLVMGLTGANCRHLFTTNTYGVGFENLPHGYGRSAYGRVVGGDYTGGANAGFDTHDEAHHFTFTACTARSGSNTTSTSGSRRKAFQGRGDFTRFEFCRSIGYDIGFELYASSNRLDDVQELLESELIGCEVYGARRFVVLGTAGDNSDINHRNYVTIDGGYFEQYEDSDYEPIAAYNTRLRIKGGARFIDRQGQQFTGVIHAHHSDIYIEDAEFDLTHVGSAAQNTRIVRAYQPASGANELREIDIRRVKVIAGDRTMYAIASAYAGANITAIAEDVEIKAADGGLDTTLALPYLRNFEAGRTRIARVIQRTDGALDPALASSYYASGSASAGTLNSYLSGRADPVVLIELNPMQSGITLDPLVDGLIPGQMLVVRNTSSTRSFVVPDAANTAIYGGDKTLAPGESFALLWNGSEWTGNIGYKTENSGTATVPNGQTTVDVNHGLSRAPDLDDISVTPIDDMGDATKFWVSNPTATTFTLHVDVDPGASGASFAWQVRIV